MDKPEIYLGVYRGDVYAMLTDGTGPVWRLTSYGVALVLEPSIEEPVREAFVRLIPQAEESANARQGNDIPTLHLFGQQSDVEA